MKVDLGTIPGIIMNGCLTAGIVFILIYVYLNINDHILTGGFVLLMFGALLYATNVYGFSRRG